MTRFIMVLAFCTSTVLSAQTQNPLQELDVPFAPDGALVDGTINDTEYEGALAFSLYNEISPNPNGTPPVLTKSWVMRDEEALIIGFECPLIDSTHLRANVQPRDEAWGDDFVGVVMDLFGDMRNTIFIASNAHGVQIDLRNNNPTVESDEMFDIGYNITYETATMISGNFWHLEMRIPFSSLQFENKEQQRWRIGFFREYYVGAQQHRAASTVRDFNNPCFDCQFNDFLLLEGIRSSARRDILPYVLGGLPVDGQKVGSPLGRIGLSAFYGLNSQNSIEVAVNPDFSTVESDAAQVDVNSATSLFYPERRPFFNEGADLTATSMNLFYSRTIANPAGMMKFLGQGKKLRTYALAGYDLNSPYLVPGENRDVVGTAGQSYASVVRFSVPRQDGENIGILSTNRIYDGGGSGHLNAVTVRENIGESWRYSGEYAWSHTVEPDTNWVQSNETFGDFTVATDGEEFSGYAFAQNLRRTKTNWETSAYWNLTSQTFRADMGFVPINNRNAFGAGHKFIGRPNKKYVKSYQIYAGGDGNITPQGLWKNQGVNTEYSFEFANNFSFGGGVVHRIMEEFEGTVLRDMSSAWNWIGWSPVQAFRLNAWINPGEFVAYNTATPRIGRGLNSGINANFQFAGKLQAGFNGNYSSLYEQDGSGKIYSGWIWRSVIRYNANRFVQARLITQWNQFNNSYLIQPLLQYQPSPFTIVYVGSSTAINGQSTTQIFAKAQVTLRPFN